VSHVVCTLSETALAVIPAEAGIQNSSNSLDPGRASYRQLTAAEWGKPEITKCDFKLGSDPRGGIQEKFFNGMRLDQIYKKAGDHYSSKQS
jgi:hypothetical protein